MYQLGYEVEEVEAGCGGSQKFCSERKLLSCVLDC